MSTRRIAAIDGAGRGTVIEEAIETPAPGQVRVRVEASLISPGTELGRVPAMREKPDVDAAPRTFGYANAGTVDAVGEGVGDLCQVGHRVACMGAGYALHADVAVVPVNLTAPVPDEVSAEEAAFAHLAATALHAIRRAQPLFGENAVVMGLGLVGQLSAQFGRLSGNHVMGVDRFPLRIDIARQCGIELAVDIEEGDALAAAQELSQGHGLDYGIIAFGGEATNAFEQIVAMLKVAPDTHRMGRIVIVGGTRISHGFASALGNVDVRSAARTGPGYHDEAYEHGGGYPAVLVEWPTRRNLNECLRAVADGRLQVSSLITHRFPLAQAADAVDALVDSPDAALGVILKP